LLYEYGFKKHYGQSYGDEAVAEVCAEVREPGQSLIAGKS